MITMGGGRFQKNPGWAFLTVIPYQNMVGAAIDWALADWKKKGKTGMPKFALMIWAGAAGNEGINGTDIYAKQKGVTWLPHVFTPPGTLKYDSWLIRFDQEGADYVLVSAVDPDQTYTIRNAHGLGLTKKIQFISGVYGLDETVGLKMVPPESVEGTIVQSPWIMGDERLKHPFASYWTTYQKKPLEEMPGIYLYGVGVAKIMQETIRLTLKETGYDKFNSEAVYRVLQKLKGDFTQGAMGPVDMSPTNRMLNPALKFYRVTNGKNVPISGWVQSPDVVSLSEYK
jgi:branched-chain amino acid transport system substrate-binding protein